jgi:hypothetical protein
VRSGIGALSLGLGSAAWAKRVEPGWLDVENVSLVLPRLHPAFDGYRIALFSDIHMDGWMTWQRLSNVVEIVNAQQPDAVAIPGDFVTRDAGRWAPELVAALKGLKPRDVTVGSLGNHDHWTNGGGSKTVRKALRDSGIVELSNTTHTIQRGKAQLHLCGVDDIWQKKNDLQQVLKKLPRDGAAILLAHEPDFADESSATGRFDLQLSGHSHGGQVRIPFFGPPIVPKFAEKYPSGQYQVGDMIQYTTRGVGNIPPRVRFNCRPEITILTLWSKVDDGQALASDISRDAWASPL